MQQPWASMIECEESAKRSLWASRSHLVQACLTFGKISRRRRYMEVDYINYQISVYLCSVDLYPSSLSYFLESIRLSYVLGLEPVVSFLEPMYTSSFDYCASKDKSFADSSQNFYSSFSLLLCESTQSKPYHHNIFSLFV